MAFKDALKDITEMFGSPEVQTIVSALGQARQAPGGRVAENLSVPFGLTFEQGSALRGEAQTADAYADARRASERAAAQEAQRVALEGRRVAEGEKAGEHERKTNTLTDAEEIQKTSELRMNEMQFDAAARQAEGEAEGARRLREISATYENQLINQEAMDASPRGQADLALTMAQTNETNARAEYLIAQSISEEVNRELGPMTAVGRARASAGALSEEDALQWMQFAQTVRDKAYETFGAEADVEKLVNREIINIYSVAYDIGALPVIAFQPYLSPEDYKEFERLDSVWQLAKATGDMTQYKLERAKLLADLIDDQTLNNSTGGGRPSPGSVFGGGAPMRPAGQGEPAPQTGEDVAARKDRAAPRYPDNWSTDTEPYLPPGSPPGAEPAQKPINVTPGAFDLYWREQLKDSRNRQRIKQLLEENSANLGETGRVY